MLALTVAIAVSVAAGVGAERRCGEGAQVAARWALNAMVYVALTIHRVLCHRAHGAATGIVVGLLGLAVVGLVAGGSRGACGASARRRPPRWSSRP